MSLVIAPAPSAKTAIYSITFQLILSIALQQRLSEMGLHVHPVAPYSTPSTNSVANSANGTVSNGGGEGVNNIQMAKYPFISMSGANAGHSPQSQQHVISGGAAGGAAQRMPTIRQGSTSREREN